MRELAGSPARCSDMLTEISILLSLSAIWISSNATVKQHLSYKNISGGEDNASHMRIYVSKIHLFFFFKEFLITFLPA